MATELKNLFLTPLPDPLFYETHHVGVFWHAELIAFSPISIFIDSLVSKNKVEGELHPYGAQT